MARGSKAKYTDKQKRQAGHIEEGYEKDGVASKRAAARAWATVNKQDGGGKKSGSGARRAPAMKAASSKRKQGALKKAKKSAPRKSKKSSR